MRQLFNPRPYGPFEMPVGVAPGFDPSHPGNMLANATSGTLGSPINRGFFSAVSLGNGFFNLWRPNIPTINGTVTQKIGRYGPGSTFTVGGTVASVDWTGPTTQPTAYTYAAIFTTETGSFASANNYVFTDSTTSFSAQTMVYTTGVLSWNYGGFGFGSENLVLDTPYFTVFSGVAGSSAFTGNAILVNLNTGSTKIINCNFAGSLFSTTPNIYRIGDGGSARGQFAGIIHAVMARHNGFCPLPGLQAWAADPWSYWYPPLRTASEKGAQATTDFGVAWFTQDEMPKSHFLRGMIAHD